MTGKSKREPNAREIRLTTLSGEHDWTGVPIRPNFPEPVSPVAAGAGTVDGGDDAIATAFRPIEGRAIISAADVLAPVVDDPFTYGQIAAANALSDIYAQGAVPLTAFTIACWPQTGVSSIVISEILDGLADIARAAGVSIGGGRRIAGDEVGFGLLVTAEVELGRVIGPAGARAGDVLLLSKPLGTGILMTAFRRARITADEYAGAVRVMTQLNAAASRAMLEHGVHAAAAVGALGLAGQALAMSQAGGVTLRIEESDLPLLPGTIERCSTGFVPAGSRRNRELCGDAVKISDEVADEIAEVFFAPEISGGLLIALAEDDAAGLLADLQNSADTDAAIVGCVVTKGDQSIELI